MRLTNSQPEPEPSRQSPAAHPASQTGSEPQATLSAPKAPDLPGITAGRYLGKTKTSGRDGVTSVWLGLDERTGARVVIRVVPGAAELAVNGLSDEHLVTTVGVHQLGPEQHAHVAEHHPAGTLQALVQRRGRLAAQETLAVLTAVSSGLADIHAAGLAHGDVSPAQVVLTQHGRPLLGGVEAVRAATLTAQTNGPVAADDAPGRAISVAASCSASKTGDVAAVAALGWFALTGRPAPAGGDLTALGDLAPHVPSALVSVILDCRVDPADADGAQPTAAAVAARLRALGPGANLELSGDDGPHAASRGAAAAGASPGSPAKVAEMAGAAARSRPRGAAIRLWRRRVVHAAGAALFATVVAAGGWAIATAEDPPSTSPVGASSPDAAAATQQAAGGSQAEPDPPATSAAPPASTATQRVPSPAGQATAPVGDNLLQTTRSADPVQALHALNELRVQALSTGDAEMLSTVNAPGSPALRHDEEVLKQLDDEHIDVRGLGVRLLWTTVLDETDDAARIQLSSQVEGHRQIAGDASASAASTHGVEAGETRTLTMELVRLAGQWRIYAVREPGSISTSGPLASTAPTATPTP